MAQISIHYMNFYRIFNVVLFLFVKAWYLLAKLRLFLATHFYTISSTSSIFLLVVNFIIYAMGCQPLHSKVFSLTIPHGYLPTFPHHFFPSSAVATNQNNETDTGNSALDSYLSQNLLVNPLTHSLPPVVHIVSCNHGPFTYANYLSVVNSFKFFKPSALYLHFNKEPEFDPDGYFQFLPDLIRDIPVISKLQLQHPRACSGTLQEQKTAYFQIIGSTGGIAINSKTLVAPSKIFRRLLDFELGIALYNDVDFVLMASAHAGVLKNIPSQSDMNKLILEKKSQEIKCLAVNNFSLRNGDPCVYILEELFPIQIFQSESDFSAIARWSGYGTSKPLVPQPADKEIVPNIVHYVWLGKRNLDFFAYISVMSSLHVLGAEAVYIHGEEPLGEWWSKVKDEPRVKVINRDFPNSVYGEPLERYVSHASDFLRADVLLRYGGVYADWDVIFLQQLPSSVRRYNATACVDWPATGSFPDVFNLGVLVAAPGAQYLQYFLESYRWYLDNHWSYNAIHMPYKVYEKNPLTLNLDRHLQVLCADNKCHAAWMKGYKLDETDHLNDKDFDWQKDAVAIHWTHPDPPAFKDFKTLLASDSVEAQIGQFVLKKSKVIP